MDERLDMRRAKGFTLVELLVVISIIALLIALLLPSLSRAKEVAGRLKCLSGARQMLIVLDTYCSDNKELYPAVDSATGTVWHVWLSDHGYLNKDLQTSRGGCPYGPAQFTPHGGIGGDYYTPTDQPASSYGLNPYIQGGWHFTGATYLHENRWSRSSMALTQKATQVGLIFCAHVPFTYASQDTCLWPVLDQDFGLPDGYLYSGLSNNRPLRHGGGAVPVGLADGHAQMMPVEEIIYPPTPTTGTGIFYYSTFWLIFSAS